MSIKCSATYMLVRSFFISFWSHKKLQHESCYQGSQMPSINSTIRWLKVTFGLPLTRLAALCCEIEERKLLRDASCMLDHYAINFASQHLKVAENWDYMFVDDDMVAHSINARPRDVKRCPTISSAAFPTTSTTGFSASRVKSQVVERGHVPRIHALHVEDPIFADICAICSALSESRFTSSSF